MYVLTLAELYSIIILLSNSSCIVFFMALRTIDIMYTVLLPSRERKLHHPA